LLRITLDTNVVDPEGLSLIEAACAGRNVDVAYTTVTDREQDGTSFASGRATVVETGVWGEPPWGRFVWGGEPISETLVLDESRVGRQSSAAMTLWRSWRRSSTSSATASSRLRRREVRSLRNSAGGFVTR
jgi:hypothetical protein